MPENSVDLNIILKLIDEATAKLKEAMGEVKKETDETQKKSDKASNSITEGFKKANSQLRDFRRMALVASAAIGTIIATTRVWAESNSATNQAVLSIGQNLKTLAGDIGSLLAPAIIGISDALNVVMPALNSFFDTAQAGFSKLNEWVTYGVQWWVAYASALQEGASSQEAMGIATNVAAAAAQQAGEEFNKAFSQDTSAQVNALEESLNNLGRTWASWIDETTQGDMISMTQQSATMQQMIGAYQQYYATTAQLNELNNSAELQSFINMTAKKKEALDDLTKKVTATSRQQVQGVLSAMGGLESALAGAQEMGRGWAIAYKAVQIATTIGNTAQGIMLAYATYPWPTSAIIAGIIAATGAIQIATIAATQFAGGTDSVPAMVTPGEMILPKTMSSAIRSGDIAISGRGGFGAYSGSPSGGTIITNYIDVKIDKPTVRSDTDIDTLVEEVSSRLANEVERIR